MKTCMVLENALLSQGRDHFLLLWKIASLPTNSFPTVNFSERNVIFNSSPRGNEAVANLPLNPKILWLCFDISFRAHDLES